MTQAPMRERRAISVEGIVQGVGFRPFVYALARRYGLSGQVHNDARGVHIEVEGASDTLEHFIRGLRDDAPPLAMVERVTWQLETVQGDDEFRIVPSREGFARQALVSPDVAVCVECLRELYDPDDRRFRYPFINCTNCGPRFTITRSVPYDRATTTMAGFTMCVECRREYDDPGDRRFHAQPNACRVCGPLPRLLDSAGNPLGDSGSDPILRTAELLRGGAVVAIKGLGGYHLACDPWNPEAVEALRGRKVRQDKPFALMALDVEQVQMLCEVTAGDAEVLASPARPIVLFSSRNGSGIAQEVAPRQRTLGVMLAYTPLHYLLLHDTGIPLVMTSGNRSDEPIAYRDDEALQQLSGIADAFLLHDRPIHMRCDDSVTRVFDGGAYPMRRSRGAAPAPLPVVHSFDCHILACGGELKNTFCLARDRRAFVSHHIGDLENYETLHSFREGIEHYCGLFDVRPELVAYDLHPEYLSTKYARELEESGIAAVGVQHHHAHIASCLTDNQRPIDELAMGIAFDGTGFGTDGAIWGGEFLVGSVVEGFSRSAHLAYTPLPGGAAAIKQPWRMAVAHLLSVYSEEEIMKLPLGFLRDVDEQEIRLVCQIVRADLNCPPTSSAGRLFDAVAALLNVPGSMRTTYEGQAAIELELIASMQRDRTYPTVFTDSNNGWIVETAPIIEGVVQDLQTGASPEDIASRFHSTMANVVVAGCDRIRIERGDHPVILSGGAFQNMLLLHQVIQTLQEKSFTVYYHRRVPANDGGISLGQAVLANSAFRAGNG